MRRATFLAAVRADFRGIAGYIAEASGSVDAGIGFATRLRAKCHELAANETAMGRSRPELGRGIRSYPFGNYMIFFRYAEDRFEVIRIIERHRDISTLARGED